MTHDEEVLAERRLKALCDRLAIASEALKEIADAGGGTDAQTLARIALERLEIARLRL